MTEESPSPDSWQHRQHRSVQSMARRVTIKSYSSLLLSISILEDTLLMDKRNVSCIRANDYCQASQLSSSTPVLLAGCSQGFFKLEEDGFLLSFVICCWLSKKRVSKNSPQKNKIGPVRPYRQTEKAPEPQLQRSRGELLDQRPIVSSHGLVKSYKLYHTLPQLWTLKREGKN